MKTLREIEVEAYLDGAILMADLYARLEDAELNNSRAFESQVEETEKLEGIISSYEKDFTDYETQIFKLKGRIEVLEFDQWRLQQLEK